MRKIEDIVNELDFSLEGINLLTSLYADSKAIKTLLTLIGELVNAEFKQPLKQLYDYMDIDKAEGVFLDILGKKWGIERPSLRVTPTTFFIFNIDAFNTKPFGSVNSYTYIPIGDLVYRRMIKFSALGLISTNNNEDITKKLQIVLPQSSHIDNQDMTISYILRGVTQEEIDLYLDYKLLPKPDGVAVNILYDYGMVFNRDPFNVEPFGGQFRKD